MAVEAIDACRRPIPYRAGKASCHRTAGQAYSEAGAAESAGAAGDGYRLEWGSMRVRASALVGDVFTILKQPNGALIPGPADTRPPRPFDRRGNMDYRKVTVVYSDRCRPARR